MSILPGQSIDPRSPHYRDRYASWARGEMQPMLFNRAVVDAGSASRVTLKPKS
jgi:penicillin amidase